MTRIDSVENIIMQTEEVIETVRRSTNTFGEFQRYTSGKMEFGSGTAAVDTNLYRSAANTLKTDDALTVVGTLTLSAGVIDPVTTATSVAGSTGPITNHGITYITSTNTKTFILTAPVAGCRKTIIRTSTAGGVATVNSTIAAAFDGTNNDLTFDAINEAVILVGLTSTRWGVVSNVGSVGIS